MKTEQVLKQLQDTETIILESGEYVSTQYDDDLYLALEYLNIENYNLILNQFNDNKKIKIMVNSGFPLLKELTIINQHCKLVHQDTENNSLYFLRI